MYPLQRGINTHIESNRPSELHSLNEGAQITDKFEQHNTYTGKIIFNRTELIQRLK